VRANPHTAMLCAAGVFSFWCARAHADDVSPIGANVDNYVTGTMDNSYVWYEQGFNPNAPATGLPPAGVIQSETNPNWSFRLQPYTGNNVLLLNHASPVGSMSLMHASTVTNIAIAVATGLGPATMVPTIHFADSTPDYVASLPQEPDWGSAQPQMLVTGYGRVTTYAYTDYFGVFREAGDLNDVGIAAPNIDIQTITLPANLASHPIASISFDQTMTTNGAAPYLTNTAIFGISSSTDDGTTYTPLDLTSSSFNKDVVVEAAALPEPAAGMTVILALVALARRRGSIV
jgi:hypothetical protein